MSEISVTTVTTANGTTDLTAKTGNTNGPVAVIYANGYIGVSNTTGSDFLIADTNVTYSNTQKGVFRNNMSAGPIESMAIHNLIVNGGMEISQENGTASSNASSYYPVDQFSAVYSGGHNVSSAQNTTSVPSENYHSSTYLSVATANASPNTANYLLTEQIIEGTFARKLGWGTANATPLTVGFWSRCSSPLTFSYYIRNVLGTDAAYLKEITVAGNTWTWSSFTVPANANGTWNSNTSTCFHTGLSLACGTDWANSTLETWLTEANTFGSTTQDNFGALGSGNTFHTTGWIAIPGEHTISAEDAHKFLLPYDHELRRCQRYFESGQLLTFFGYVTSGYFYGEYVPFKVNKRTTPSVTQTNTGVAIMSTTPSNDGAGVTGFRSYRISTATNGSAVFNETWLANARMS